MKYGSKHPAGAQADTRIAEALERVADNGRVTCPRAHAVAAELRVPPAEVGRTMDLLEMRIVECQMGIFGYQPEKKVLKAADTIPTELRDGLLSAAPEGRICCADCWGLAVSLGIEKSEVAAACESLGLKIKPCQLGAF